MTIDNNYSHVPRSEKKFNSCLARFNEFFSQTHFNFHISSIFHLDISKPLEKG